MQTLSAFHHSFFHLHSHRQCTKIIIFPGAPFFMASV
jgi:hypothetical protein